MALEYIRLMTPLVLPGRLAVRVFGQPSTSEEHMALSRISRAAQRARAHRSHGSPVVDVRFVGMPASEHLETPTRFVVNLNAMDVHARIRRVWICAGFAVTFVFLFISHGVKKRRSGITSFAVVSEHVNV